MPMKITSVSVPPTLLQSMPSASWPVTNVTTLVCSRCVSGTPVYAAMPSGDVTPGTISKATPAAANASASSPPRPKMNGSPPFSRTTFKPRRARSIIMAQISSWLKACTDFFLPT